MSSGSLRSPDLTPDGDALQKPAGLGLAIEELIPLSFSQQQLWYVCQFQSGTIAYNQPVAWRLRGKLNAKALEDSLNAIIRRHQALRTTFPCVEGSPVQCIHRELLLNLQIVDLREVPESAREARAHELAVQEARYPFDLASALLVRATLLRTRDEEYVLVLLVHHIVCDGWSMGVLINELMQLYREFSAGKQSTLPIPAAQYSDFTLWQREYLQGENRERQISYWKKQLDGARSSPLPSTRPRPAVPSFRGVCQFFSFPKALTEAFKALCAREEVFLFMGLLAVFQTLVHRYTGQSDVVIGSPVAGRKRSKFQGTIGLLLNVMALRTDFSDDPTFRDLLKRVRGVVMQGYQHQDLPFEQVVEEVRPTRQQGQNPLFQMILDQVDSRWIAFDLPEVKAEWFPVDHQTSKFDITFAWFDSPQGLRGWLEYSTDLFDAGMIARMLEHFQTLIESAVANPDQPVSKLPLLPAQERQQLFVEWNTTKSDYAADACIHDLFEAQVRRTPEVIAVKTDDRQFTFEQLNRRANQLAHYLMKAGVGSEMLVGVSLDRNCDLMVALLAVLKTGAAYVPLDPSYPEPRLSFMLRDAGLKTVLTEERWSNRLAGEIRTICLDRDWQDIGECEETNPGVPMSSNAVAYVIYTSGSTGRPKGVLGLHRGAVNRFAWMWNKYPFADGEVACAKTPLSFVDSVWELFGPLLAGIPIVLIPNETTRDPESLGAALARNRVTRLVLVPSLLRAMLEAEPHLQNRLPLLKYWVSSGEALSTDLVKRFRESVPAGILINLYGSSEVSADVTCYDTREMPPEGPVPIGRPIANTQAYILDANLQPVSIGIPGELCVSGDGLARGYLNNPEQTAAKFIPHPFGRNGQDKLYRTGDLARYRPDGNIELLGRVDNQVKIRGFRIEPEEIESLLKQHSSVAQAVVVARSEASGNPRLIAYIVPNRCDQVSPSRPDQSVATDLNQACKADAALTLAPRLRRYLQERLPDHMVPAAFLTLDSLPLLPNGKTDRNALPAPQTARPSLAQEYVEPRTAAERKIHEAWQEVLQVDRIGVHDNFFDLGGHSLLLVTVQNKLAKAFNREILSVDLYRYPTISSLAERLDGRAAEPRSLEHARQRAIMQKESLQRRRAILAARSK
jgi:amino acid adenylation domain-containing protein